LNPDIGGTAAGQFDQLNVTGKATLAGTLNITLVDGFTPILGRTWSILTYGSEAGDFATKNLGGFSSATAGAKSDVLKA